MTHMVPPSQGPSSQGSLPTSIPPGHLGNHQVQDVSKGVNGIVDKAKYEVGRLASHWNEMGEKEKFYYKTAALCAIIAILIILFIANLFGVGGVLFGMHFAAIPWGGGMLALSKAGAKTRARRPWEMPPYSAEVKGNKAAEKQWQRLWTERNQAKAALTNVKGRLTYSKRMQRNYFQEEAYSKVLLKQFEDAEVAFWKFADKEKAYTKIDHYNESRRKRNEPTLFQYY